MERNEYLAKLKEIEEKCKKEKNAFILEFALSNAKFKVGDIIKDHRWIIKIDKISASMITFSGVPDTIYYGVELKKDLTPKKSGERQSIVQYQTVENITLVKKSE